ncbi:MAG: SRPBCC domain-containing protein [Frankia sp.]
MLEKDSTHPAVPDISTSVTVAVPVAVPVTEAFRIFAERAIEWLPAGHRFLRDPRSITMEPAVGGRFYERGADGTEITRGTIVEWAPPHRLVMTWRVGPHWQPIFDDEKASLVEIQFTPAGPGTTGVVLTHTQLHRHGDFAATISSAIGDPGPGPGETLQRYTETVARHTSAGRL